MNENSHDVYLNWMIRPLFYFITSINEGLNSSSVDVGAMISQFGKYHKQIN